MILNLLAIRKVVPQKPKLLPNILRSLPPALIMGAVVFLCYTLLIRFLGEDISRVILCGVPIMAAGVVYLVLAVLCKAFTREDCMLLPKGEKIARLLKL
jgi:stage V sporulation protein B